MLTYVFALMHVTGSELPVFWQCTGHPQSAVAGERSDFEDAFGSRHAYEVGHEGPLLWGDLHSMHLDLGKRILSQSLGDGGVTHPDGSQVRSQRGIQS